MVGEVEENSRLESDASCEGSGIRVWTKCGTASKRLTNHACPFVDNSVGLSWSLTRKAASRLDLSLVRTIVLHLLSQKKLKFTENDPSDTSNRRLFPYKDTLSDKAASGWPRERPLQRFKTGPCTPGSRSSSKQQHISQSPRICSRT